MVTIATVKIRRLLVNLILLAVSISFALALSEIYLRVFRSGHLLSDQDTFAYFDDSAGIPRLIPNKETYIKYPEFEYILKSNSRGLRDYEYPYEKGKDVFRIIILGDSFTFGQGVELEYVFAKQIENKLKNRSFLPAGRPAYRTGRQESKKVEVINMGMPGYGSDSCYKFLIKEGYKYAPDLVIYAFFVNDFNETQCNVEQEIKRTKSNELISKKSNSAIKVDVLAGAKQLLYKSYTYHFLLNNLKKISSIRNFLYASGISKHNWPLYYINDYIQFDYDQGTEESVNSSFSYISEMQVYCENIRAELLIVYLPDYFQVYYTTLRHNETKFYDEKYDMDKPQNLIFKFCNRNHIPFINTTPFLQQKARSQRLYYDSDQHFTKKGHDLVANVIVDRFEKLDIIARAELEDESI